MAGLASQPLNFGAQKQSDADFRLGPTGNNMGEDATWLQTPVMRMTSRAWFSRH